MSRLRTQLTVVRIGPIVFGLLLSVGLPAAAQSTVASASDVKAPVYDVSTIKWNKSGSSSSGTHTYNNIFTASNVSIRELLQQSFNIRQELISGLPSWAEGARFDISAKIVDLDMEALRKLKRPQREMMLRSLLVERFGLKWHIETKSLPIYEMVVAKGGAKLKPNPETSNPNGSMSTKNNDFTAHNIQLISLAELLSDELQRPVRDKTGLDGRYDFELKWSRDESSAAPSGDSNAGDALPSFFTALQEQLGLKLQPAQGPVDTLVIDHLEVPTEN